MALTERDQFFLSESCNSVQIMPKRWLVHLFQFLPHCVALNKYCFDKFYEMSILPIVGAWFVRCATICPWKREQFPHLPSDDSMIRRVLSVKMTFHPDFHPTRIRWCECNVVEPVITRKRIFTFTFLLHFYFI